MILNKHLDQLNENYLFPEIRKRCAPFADENLISLGIGDTTQCLIPAVVHAMQEEVKKLAHPNTYEGYGPALGLYELREAIANTLYENITPEEVMISDGAKCDILRLLMLFDHEMTVYVQDPSYPVYTDTALMTRRKVKTLPCTKENGFFPDLSQIEENSLIFFCSPNNPTGHAATHEQLQHLVDVALQRHCVIIMDTAYACFITDPTLPKSIFEIEGAKNCAIEVGSFSKMAGFTGIRASWTIVPEIFRPQWERILSTTFNGTSRISQAGALAALSPQGLDQIDQQISYYLENVDLLKEALDLPVYGGENSPYLWVDISPQNSWEMFQTLLEEEHLVVTPGSGFGPSGEGYIRLSAFATREDTIEATTRLQNLLALK